MPVYLVTYDLIAKANEARDYDPIYEALDKFPNRQVLYSVFLVEADAVLTIEAALQPSLRKGDRYFITRLRSNGFRYRAMPGVNQWLLDHPPG